MSSDFGSDRAGGGKGSGFRGAGPGAHQSFMCPLCAKPRQVYGRKRQRVQGLSTWVCHGGKAKEVGPK